MNALVPGHDGPDKNKETAENLDVERRTETSELMLECVENVADILKEAMPEYRGITVFGSVARGEARPDSDVDIFVLINPDETAPVAARLLENTPDAAVTSTVEDGPLEGATHFHGAIDIDYKFTVMDMLKAQGINKADVIVMPVDQEVVDTGTQLVIDSVVRYESEGTRVVPRNIEALFHAQVGAGDLLDLQQAAIKKLLAAEKGEVAWRMIRHMVIAREQGRGGDYSDPSHRKIPADLQEAAEMFGLGE